MNSSNEYGSKTTTAMGSKQISAYWACVHFLSEIGIAVQVEAGATGFLQGIRIKGETILVSEASDDLAGDLLHEAGHIAVVPTLFRPHLTSNVDDVFALMQDYLDSHPHALLCWPEDPVARGIIQSGETEAIAWSYAAARFIGIDTMLPFKKGLDGNGKDLHDSLAAGRYLGIHGLAHAGMTDLPRRGRAKSFPDMKRWMQA